MSHSPLPLKPRRSGVTRRKISLSQDRNVQLYTRVPWCHFLFRWRKILSQTSEDSFNSHSSFFQVCLTIKWWIQFISGFYHHLNKQEVNQPNKDVSFYSERSPHCESSVEIKYRCVCEQLFCTFSSGLVSEEKANLLFYFQFLQKLCCDSSSAEWQ